MSTIVPLLSDNGFAPKLNTSSALVAALAAAITRLNVSSFVVEPDAYDKTCGPLPEPVPSFPLVTDNCGVPLTVTFSLNITFADSVNPSDLSAAVVIQSISVMSA